MKFLNKPVKTKAPFLKTEESIDRNISKVVGFLSGKDRFARRDKP